jgi:DNA polymerase-1
MALLNENEMSFALKNLATKYLNEPSDTFAELFGKDAKFAEVPLDIA